MHRGNLLVSESPFKMIRENKIEEILNNETNKKSKLALACKNFLNYHASFRNNVGDVIYGLKELDRLKDRVEQLLKKNL